MKDDLLTTQEILGTNLMYEDQGGTLIAIELNDDGDVIARYRVGISLEKL